MLDPVSGCSTSSTREGPQTPDWMDLMFSPQTPFRPCLTLISLRLPHLADPATMRQAISPLYNSLSLVTTVEVLWETASPGCNAYRVKKLLFPRSRRYWHHGSVSTWPLRTAVPWAPHSLSMSVASYLAAAGEATEIYTCFIHTYTTNSCIGSCN